MTVTDVLLKSIVDLAFVFVVVLWLDFFAIHRVIAFRIAVVIVVDPCRDSLKTQVLANFVGAVV
jgi:hypothetical protein